ncbi:hypothetical protein PLANPX_4400 [Lacipirellula parvula]|uniref:Uncharacterized protein n=1 Tax=Lacipirellula parvula TaxID=2650471 RepID=A0A5K7XE76_9BACT|nr:hypothetical protein PLANPX_4400 [Lacipirellula parvula]
MGSTACTPASDGIHCTRLAVGSLFQAVADRLVFEESR